MIHPLEALTEQPLREGEYRKDGLVYCAACHTPRQRMMNLGERVFLVRCLCRCQTEKREAEEAAARQREFWDRVAANRSVGLSEPALRQFTFANDKGYNPEIRVAKKYAEHWEEVEREASGLLFWGGVGTGKTYLAGCIANALLDQGVTVMMTNFSRVLSDLPGMFSGDRNRYLDSFNRFRLLIIDDFGAERSSEFALEQVFNIIDGRTRARKPLIVTTNLSLPELKHPDSLAKARIYDRLLERCVPVRVHNRNLRQENAQAQLQRVKKLLE